MPLQLLQRLDGTGRSGRLPARHRVVGQHNPLRQVHLTHGRLINSFEPLAPIARWAFLIDTRIVPSIDHLSRLSCPSCSSRKKSPPQPPTPQLRWHSNFRPCQNAQRSVFTCLLWQKAAPSPPIIPQIPPKTPVQTAHAPVTLPPCSNPCPIRTILSSAPTPTQSGRPATTVPMPTSQHHEPCSLKPDHLPANTTKTAAKTLPSAPNSAPRPTQCPTGIGGYERE